METVGVAGGGGGGGVARKNLKHTRTFKHTLAL